MNRVELTGRLTRDPELRFVGASDYPICTLNVAVDDGDSRWNRETQKREIGSGFYRVEVAGSYGEAVQQIAVKGDEVYVIGSLGQFQRQGKDGGESTSHTTIKAKFVQVLKGEVVDVVQAGVPTTGGWDDEDPF